MKTPWEILEIPQSATPEEIKAAYRKLAKDNHPDVGGDHDKFLEIKQAYETLTAPQQSNNHNSQFNPFEQFFKNMGGGFHQQFRNINHEVQINISIAESINGCSRSAQTFDKTIDLTIPPGCQNGDVIKYANIINSGKDMSPGNLFVHIIIQPPTDFVWKGVDLLCERTISIWDAMLGTVLTIKDPLGINVNVTVPESTQPNTILRIPQCGGYSRANKSRSDLLINITVSIPKLTQDQKFKIINLIK